MKYPEQSNLQRKRIRGDQGLGAEGKRELLCTVSAEVEEKLGRCTEVAVAQCECCA